MENKNIKIKSETHNELLDVSQAAQYLNVNKMTIRRLVNGREITFYRVKSKILIKTSDIEQYLENNKVEGFYSAIKKVNIRKNKEMINI